MKPSDNPTLSIGRSRRDILKAVLGAAAATILASGWRVPVSQAQRRVQPEAPDAGWFARPDNWCACLPPQEWFSNGDWVMQKTLELLKPDHWHSWGDLPENGYPGRIPMIFSTQYFDHDRVRRRMAANSGEFWMGPNEPEMPFQCNEPPNAIADLTCTLIDIGTSADTEWQWGSPAITLTADGGGMGGIKWLTEWNRIMRRRRGIAKPFAWMIHPYHSWSVSKFHESMDAWWEWYAVWGNHTPVVIHEVCAEDAGPEVQADVMLECYKLLRSGMVSGVFWFATYRSAVEEQKRQRINRNPWQHYALTVLDHGTQTVAFTELGQYWKELQHGLRATQ